MDGARRAMDADGRGFQIAADRFFGSPFGEPKMNLLFVFIHVHLRLSAVTSAPGLNRSG
jgi:hypothetical protein